MSRKAKDAGQSTVPLYPVPAAFLEEPFTGADIRALAHLSSMPLATDADPDSLAAQLGRVFRDALDWVAMDAGSPRRDDALRVYEGVARHARSLLELLSLPTDPAHLLSMHNDEIDAARGMAMLRADGANDFGDSRSLANRLAQRGCHILPDTADQRRARVLPLKAITAPFAVATLLTLAEGAADAIRATEGKPGAPRDNFSEVLFNGLAWFHKQMFGTMPVIDGADRGDRKGWSGGWAGAVLVLAGERLPGILVANHAGEAAASCLDLERAALKSAAELELATIAKRLSAASSFIRSQAAAL